MVRIEPSSHLERHALRWPDLSVAIDALRLAILAQKVRRDQSLLQVQDRMLRLWRLSTVADPARAATISRWACEQLDDFFGLLNSCLVRSLVLASLLADRDAVALHLGLRDSEFGVDPVDGHAWVTLEGSPVPAGSDIDDSGAHYTRTTAVRFSRS